ncbi:uncharacterized membrane protein YqaE (UPF0057 family) [Aureimonas jatrophae]|nr:uncharacterized membrane protein YqaE (UPF0057 family) [Aureimonas jatrophae]
MADATRPAAPANVCSASGTALPPFRSMRCDTVSSGCLMDLIKIIIAIILPPLGVFMEVGLGKHFWINIILTLLGYIPGIVHAVWVIARR